MTPRALARLLRRHHATEHTGQPGGFVPDSIRIGSRHLEVGGDHSASFAVIGYPREVTAGWLQPLLAHPGRVDVSLHISPVDPSIAAGRLRKQLARLESGRRSTYESGKLADPQAEAAAEDAADLAHRLARCTDKLFTVGLYITVHATSETALADEVSALRSLAASVLLDARPCSFRALQGWITTLPLGLDQIAMTRTFDTSALAAAFPFTSPDLPAPDPASAGVPNGSLVGFNLGSQGLVHHDVFACDNYNTVILGRSGAGKSYWVKTAVLRAQYRGIHAVIVDPEDEYGRMARAVGGTVLDIGAPGIRFNPFDLPVHVGLDGRRSAPRDALTRQTLFLQTAIAVMCDGTLTAHENAVLDTAITTTYAHAGITSDPRTWTRPAPLLRDLAEVLRTDGGAVAADLVARLHPYTHGSASELFAGPTTARTDGHLVVFSLRQLPDELKSVGTLLVLNDIWRTIANPALRRRRLVVVDEAWLLMRLPEGARFLFRMAKTFRKYWAGLTLASQDTADVLGSELGRAVIANSATQILLRQATQAIAEVTDTFSLSEGEKQFLLTADRGQGLMSVGAHRVAVQVIASPTEHELITTDPAELAHLTTGAPGQLDLDDEPAPQDEDAVVDLDPA
ncbi:ATP-binding protein [Allokutzneria sp. A3M-2-11 16]|uniref:VirB4 family type IV secretion system protein n=1 Tax=Allokutzneria sp. A3M-2-11 16 TaxID=2962043 RepID=UPI0020B87359|nr:ATP-binding protein [Allokutzneria sp. A3M-2-11 16]MCP3800724.1 ATP-binding protein [Allokutzneria sp. A3M-2-11 16]